MRHFRLYPQDFLRRRWTSTHPFRPRVSRRRRFAWIVAFLLLSSLIAAYEYIADPQRLRTMAQTYLSSVLGGEVRIGSARLSIFQGLTLQDVRVFTANAAKPDALIFSARNLRLDYDLPALLRGQVQATQIIATQPQIRLVQNLDTKTWNYEHLLRMSRKGGGGKAPSAPPALPEIILREGQIENAQVVDGRYTTLGSLWFEGRLGPGESEGRYTFTVQSRPGDTSHAGPQVTGWFDPADGRAQLALRDFTFGPAIRAMLPEKVRIWCTDHQLAGALTIDQLWVTPRPGGGKSFEVHMRVDGVGLALSPDEWRSAKDNHTVEQIHDSMETLSDLGVGNDSLIGKLTHFADSPPMHLHILSGALRFSDTDGIRIENLVGQLENYPFAIQGVIAGYSAESPFHIELSCPGNSVMRIPSDPKYIRALPVGIQQAYDQFKPVGTCRVVMHIDRSGEGAAVAVVGQVDIIDGRFVFDHFPYPLRQVHGQLLIRHNSETGAEELDIPEIVGRGIAGGPNANSFVRFTGTAGPFNRDCQVHLKISGTNITSEAPVVAAMPPETQSALKIFDAAGHGEYPKFHGNFLCLVERSPKTDFDWDIDTHLDIDRAAGALVAFPYPIDNLAMQLDVHGNHLDITNAHMQRGAASLKLDGRVSWKSDDDHPEKTMTPQLTVSAQNVPIDEDLLNALPAARSTWIRQAGLSGNVDINGRVFPDPAGDVSLDLSIHLHDGQILHSHTFDSLAADARLTDTAVDIPHISARRGNGQLTGAAFMSWAADPPKIRVSLKATNLLMDNSLRDLLPAAGKKMWDQLNPTGTLDADASYQSPNSLKLTVRPRTLRLAPPSVPWPLDHLTGTASYDDGQVNLDNLTAHHGSTMISLSGAGSTGTASNWQLHLRGQNMSIDADFLRKAPKPLADLIHSLNLHGQFDFEFNKLLIHGNSTGDIASSDIDFAVDLAAHSASLDAGIPLTKIHGSCSLAGSLHDGSLYDLLGSCDFDSLEIASRPATDLTFKITKAAGRDAISLSDISGSIADGSLAGQVNFNNDHYTINLVLRDADIPALAPDAEHDIHGQLSASLNIEGDWSDPNTRIGRGDVLVTGQQLYKIPILLGISQITNLSLPLNEPFTEGTARYAVQGQNVVFDSIALKASNMEMTGTGQMDFASKKFDLLFTTNNPKWPKIPLINDFVVAAERQFLQIRVSGTISEPKVSAGILSAVPTTIERVMGK